MTLRVAHLLPDLAMGGGQVIVRNLVTEPVDGVDHHVVALGGGPAREWFEQAGVPLSVLPVRGLNRAAGAAAAVSRILGRLGAHLVHVNNTPLDRLVGQMAALPGNRPVVNTFMAIATSHRPRGQAPWGPFLRRRAGNVANRVLARTNVAAFVALSEVVRRSHAEALRMAPDRITVIPPGLPDEAYREVPPAVVAAHRAQLGLGDAYPVLISVGRVEANKGQRDLLPATRALLDRFPGVAVLVVGDGDDRAGLEAEVAATGLGRHVRVLGQRADVRQLLALSDVFVSTARHEGFGMAALEALAAGVPVVAQVNPHVAIAEFVTDGRSGRLVRGHDPVELAAAVVDLTADRLRLKVASREAAAAAEGLRARASAAAHAELYASVVAGERPGRRRAAATA